MTQIFASERPSGTHNRPVAGGHAPDQSSPVEQKLHTLQKRANDSPATQRLAQLEAAVPTQRMEEEELMQGKGLVTQRIEEEDLLQGHGLNANGLPSAMQAGMEQASGADLSDVKVHYNSAEPAALQAHAYAQGTDIHLGPGQEKHLGHEAWHTVQQKNGRVQPTTDVAGVPVNDSPGLEAEADRMGAKFS